MLNLNNEIWKPIKGFEKIYFVSNLGRVRNSQDKVMKTYTNNSGYFCIKLTVEKKATAFLVHRLVAINFIDNYDELPEVNHIDEDKSNNALSNLEWCSSSYNKQHSIATGRYDKLYTTKNTLGKKHKKTCKSKYHNVTWDKNRERWQASVRHEKKTWHQKRFKSEKDAALHVNWIIDELDLIDRPKNVI